MRRKKLTTPLLMMGISLLLLIVLQALWLRTEYRSAVNAFSRETNMTFRGTLHQLSDSIFFGSVSGMAGNDSIQNENGRQFYTGRNKAENIRHITVTGTNTIDQGTDPSDTLPKNWRHITIAMADNEEGPADSLTFVRRISPSAQDMRWIFTGDLKGFDKDSIAFFYRRNLNPAYSQLKFDILEREFSFNYPRPPRQTMSDSLPFTTSYYPFARMLYAAEFENAQWLIMKKLLPQTGFSIFTTLLIFISFLLVYRNLRTQQKLMEQKDNFVANITHELKTPVASVGVAIEAIKNFDVLKNKKRAMEYLDLAGQELNRLGILTDKILKTTLLDYGDEIRQNQTQLDLAEIVEKILVSFRIQAIQKNLELHFVKNGSAPVKGNEEHLTQAIYNLLDNAFKYASEGKYIGVDLKETNDQVILEVVDKGPGISPEHKQKIFEKFYRIPTGNVHNVKGYGLGLHYVSGVVKHHNGKITVYSTPGKGSRFVVNLPK
jgi:two-component system, OmpR family, phosphate regulon sensor histidine kinase PhoR